MKKRNVGGGEVTNDFHTVSVTGAFTITCTFDRLYHPDGKGFSDEEMIAVGKDYISNENFRIGRDTNTDRYFITGSQRLTKDDAVRLMKEFHRDHWNEALVRAKKQDDDDFIFTCLLEIRNMEDQQTFADVAGYFSFFVREQFLSPEELFTRLLETFVKDYTGHVSH